MSFWKKISFTFPFVLPPVGLVSAYLGGFYLLSLPILIFVILPILDICMGGDKHNPSEQDVEHLSEQKYFRFLTYAWAFLQLFYVIWACLFLTHSQLAIWEMALFALSTGLITGGIGITVGHELGHKNTRWEQFLSKMIYMTVSYMHFFIEHNRGHHVHVSTMKDSATSRENQSFYSFYPQTVIGSFLSAWKIEAKRLQNQNRPIWSLANDMIVYLLITFGFVASLTLFGSFYSAKFVWQIPVFFFLQSFVATLLLELTNYIEHYGLERKEISPGKFEKVDITHSWNQNFFVSNAFLFHLQRHSDHHANANRRYQVLRHVNEAPQLPFGYEVMIVIALVPPLWFRLMNPRLESWRKSLQHS
ncbi:putative alkane 1-monooxygenase [Leptospira ryugenii]|uniref:Putative alkane 1-monooxygenase n=1 Tax=Leptospira ryugenii TaxID=1917863 RepID=A0A2P2DVV7_9LEPT|nr:alkane 1-monooxygenase [Leptospira ryugenii]GBF48700.1 putative alkane 1-monooxygenase [Leptospira ryugenii]